MKAVGPCGGGAMGYRTTSMATTSTMPSKKAAEAFAAEAYAGISSSDQEADGAPVGKTQGVPKGQLCAPAADCKAVCRILVGSWLNVLLVFVPIGMIAKPVLDLSATAVFVLNFLAIIPLASILGEATEDIAAHVGQTLGGLLNATFGNAVEMIMATFALREGLIEVVQGTLLGSILSNLLLVLGMSFFAGGMKHHTQKFNATGASANSSLLLMACMAITLPTCYHVVMGDGDSTTVSPCQADGTSANGTHLTAEELTTCDDHILMISRLTSVLLGGMYVQYLVFQLGTHRKLFEDDVDEEEVAQVSVLGGIVFLMVTTLLVAANSDALVKSIEGLTVEAGLGEHFVGIVLLPIVGNAAEHLTAVTAAMKNKMNLAIGVAVGSSTQIALFVVPFTVLAGWVMEQPMTLDFHVFAAVVLILSVLIVNAAIADGESNWLEGSLLMHCYIISAIVFWYL